MRIAQVAPLHESVPPVGYGGTERIVSYLTEELVRQGHDVTLFASGDSQTHARLVAPRSRSLRLDQTVLDPLAPHWTMLEEVTRVANEFDIIHYHLDYLAYPFMRRQKTPGVSTLHGRLDLKELPPLYREFSDVPVLSISVAQRRPLPWLNWRATVYHGIPVNEFHAQLEPQGYLAFVGRISPEKGPDRAIEIAAQAGMPLKIAAKVDRADKEYFEKQIEPLLRESPHVEFVGEIGQREKQKFFGGASALLFPIDWPEPFGLVTIEAMACGTPVIAFNCGSVPEVIEPGVTGAIVDTIPEAVAAVREVTRLDRGLCRQAYEKRFTAERMAHDYVRVYQELIAIRRGEGRGNGPKSTRRDYTGTRALLRTSQLLAR